RSLKILKKSRRRRSGRWMRTRRKGRSPIGVMQGGRDRPPADRREADLQKLRPGSKLALGACPQSDFGRTSEIAARSDWAIRMCLAAVRYGSIDVHLASMTMKFRIACSEGDAHLAQLPVIDLSSCGLTCLDWLEP